MTKEQISFFKSMDFMRLGQAINQGKWQAAAMTLRRMEKTAKECDMGEFNKWFAAIKQCVFSSDKAQALSIMTLVTNKRVQYLNKINGEMEKGHEEK